MKYLVAKSTARGGGWWRTVSCNALIEPVLPPTYTTTKYVLQQQSATGLTHTCKGQLRNARIKTPHISKSSLRKNQYYYFEKTWLRYRDGFLRIGGSNSTLSFLPSRTYVHAYVLKTSVHSKNAEARRRSTFIICYYNLPE